MSQRRLRNIVKMGFKCLFAALMFLCFAQAVFYSSRTRAGEYARIMTGAAEYIGREALTLQEQTKEGQITYTIWGEQRGISVLNPDLDRKADASLITICGESGLISASSFFLVTGNTKSCLITEDLCQQLFGGSEYGGQSIQAGEKLYEVRGILPDLKYTVMVEADQKSEASMDKISVKLPNGKLAGDTVRKLSSQLGIPPGSVSFAAYHTWARAAAMLLPCILAGSIFIPLIKNTWKYRYVPAKLIKYLPAAIFCLLAFFWITGIWPGIPKEILPSKWSDFKFWSELWNQKWEELSILLKGEKTGPEMVFLADFLSSLRYSLLSVVFYFLSLYRVRIKRWRELYLWSAFFMSLAFEIFVYRGEYASFDNGVRILWVLIPFYLWGRELSDRLSP